MAAIDYLLLKFEPDAQHAWRQRVILENTNTARGIVGTIQVTGTQNFQIETFDRSLKRAYLPQSFEVRVAPGGFRQIGTTPIRHFTAPKTWQDVATAYRISGGRYVDQEPWPLPPPPTEANLFILSYRVPTIRAGIKVEILRAISTNHLYAARIRVHDSASNKSFSTVLEPLGQGQLLEIIHNGQPESVFRLESVEFMDWDAAQSTPNWAEADAT